MTTLNKVRKAQTVTQKTYNKLAQAISSNTLLPGQQLIADSLASELGVSRTPVREAFLILAQDGLVELVPGVGAFVKGLELEDLLELFEFRESIEIYAVKSFVRNPKPALIDKLKSSLENHRDPQSRTAIDAAAEADLEVHYSLVKALNNRRMLNTWETIARQLRRFWVDGRSEPGRARADIEESLTILDAIENQDAERALNLMKEHLDTSRQSLIEWRKSLDG